MPSTYKTLAALRSPCGIPIECKRRSPRSTDCKTSTVTLSAAPAIHSRLHSPPTSPCACGKTDASTLTGSKLTAAGAAPRPGAAAVALARGPSAARVGRGGGDVFFERRSRADASSAPFIRLAPVGFGGSPTSCDCAASGSWSSVESALTPGMSAGFPTFI